MPPVKVIVRKRLGSKVAEMAEVKIISLSKKRNRNGHHRRHWGHENVKAAKHHENQPQKEA